MNQVSIYSDGGCWPNPGHGGWGAVILGDGERRELRGKSSGTTTNNRMEIVAAIEALRSLSSPSMVDVFTDSQYLKKGASEWIKSWKRWDWTRKSKGRDERTDIINADLWKELDGLLQLHKVRWHWVKGHADCAENQRADALAER